MVDTVAQERLGRERRLMFTNYANGVDIEAMKEPFHRSAAEIERDILFVAKKITEYRFRRNTEGTLKQREGWNAGPPIQCDTLFDIRLRRKALLETLRKIGDLTLSSELLLPKIAIQKVDSREAFREVHHRVNA